LLADNAAQAVLPGCHNAKIVMQNLSLTFDGVAVRPGKVAYFERVRIPSRKV